MRRKTWEVEPLMKMNQKHILSYKKPNGLNLNIALKRYDFSTLQLRGIIMKFYFLPFNKFIVFLSNSFLH